MNSFRNIRADSIPTVADATSRLAFIPPSDGYSVVQLDTDAIYIWNQSSQTWVASGGGGGGSGTVTSVAVATANGFAGTVATATTTPSITLKTTITGLIKGNGTAISAAVAGTDYQAPITLTTTGTSGASTFTSNTLNIPQYQAAGNYISSLTADGTASGPGAAALTLATVNSNVGSFGSASSVMTQSVNAKGLTTAAASVSIQIAESQVTNLTTDLAGKQGTLTLTTTGTSGASTLIGNTLNIPQYTGSGGSGTVTTVSVVSANGLAGTVANSTTTPAITLSTSVTGIVKGNGTTFSAATSGTDYAPGTSANTTGLVKSTTSTGALTTAVAGTDYQAPISLTTTGSSGAATFIGNVLNIPQYTGSGGSGTVTTVSVVSANGFTGTVANATTTPAITLTTSITGLLKGNGTAISAATAGTDYQIPINLTTTGTSGAATFTSGTLNIPNYANTTYSADGTTLTLTGTTFSVNTTYAATLATLTGTQTLTNKTINKKVTTPASATSITPNSDTSDIVYQTNTTTAGAFTVNADTGTSQTEGKSLVIELNCTNVQTFSWNAQYKAGVVPLPTATTGGGKTDYYSFIWSSTASGWRFTGNALGF